MAGPTELSFDAVRDFLILNNGVASNHDLVKHFKKFLTNPLTRDEARQQFKEIVNEVAVIKKENNEKFLVLRKRFRPQECSSDFSSPGPSPSPSASEMGSRMFFNSSLPSSGSQSPRLPPPYRPPPPALSPTSQMSPTHPMSPPIVRQEYLPPVQDPESPPVPPRRRSSADRVLRPEAMDENTPPSPRPSPIVGDIADVMESELEQKISVKERMQKFNRMATENDAKMPASQTHRRRIDKDDDDSCSVTSLDPKTREWLVSAARGDYHALAKLAGESPRLIKTKDPTTYTALHWAAKHGNENMIKLIVGKYKLNPNVRSGYTPLHLAMQFEHEDIFNLLVQVYAADQNLRDWSGRKPRQYQVSLDTAVSADTFRKIKARKKHAEKESGFLRIGSLNVRVKKTTEAFSHYFLGQSSDKLHKTWGSADNVHHGGKTMPPPKYGQIKKRKSKREADFLASRSTPGTPTQQHRASVPSTPTQHRMSTTSFASLSSNDPHDSDSDTAAGFGAQWQG